MPGKINFHEIYKERAFFQELGGFSAPDFTGFCHRHRIPCIHDSGHARYPVFEVMKAINSERKLRTGLKKEPDDLDKELKRERVIKERILNQKNMGLLIPISDAKARIVNVLSAVTNSMRYSIKSAATRVALCNNVRDCENILTEDYNNAIETLTINKAKIQSWEEMGANTKLRRVELLEDSEETSGVKSSRKDAVTR